jgi:uncharacterized protein YihD (DUF1040 family)
MRDPKRIPSVLLEVQKLWEKHPDIRLGQLLVNVLGNSEGLFSCEDGRLVRMLKEFDSRHPASK